MPGTKLAPKGKEEKVSSKTDVVVVERNGVAQVPSALVAEGSGPNVLHPGTGAPSQDAITPGTAERVGQIISSQTSLSKELQCKLPRLGEGIASSGSGREESSENKLGTGKEEEEGVNTVVEGDMTALPSTDSVSSSLNVTEVAVSTISTELHDLPEELSVEWKMAREEEKRREEEEREERHKVRRVRRDVVGGEGRCGGHVGG